MTDMVQQSYIPVQMPGRVSQATSVEQARAIADVMAAVQAARAFPRSAALAVAEMEAACKSPSLAKRAFYSFPRGGQRVTGPTVELARELARCWGNIDYGISELSRDEESGTSEMKAWAWDLQSNNRVSTTFIVLHRRDTKDGTKVLTDARDVYETIANNGARREREMILRTIPGWFRDRAIELCQQSLNNGDAPAPLRIEQQRARAIEAFNGLGVTREQLEKRAKRPVDSWTAADLADLNVLFREIDTNALNVDDVFGDPDVTNDDVTGGEQRTGDDGRPAQWPVQPWPAVAQPGGEQ